MSRREKAREWRIWVVARLIESEKHRRSYYGCKHGGVKRCALDDLDAERAQRVPVSETQQRTRLSGGLSAKAAEVSTHCSRRDGASAATQARAVSGRATETGRTAETAGTRERAFRQAKTLAHERTGASRDGASSVRAVICSGEVVHAAAGRCVDAVVAAARVADLVNRFAG